MMMRLLSLLAALSWCLLAPARAEDVRIGIVKVAAAGGIYIAIEKGYFAAEGINASVTWFASPEPIALATVGGDIEVGVTGSSAAIYSLGAQGALKVIAAQAHEAPGFRVNGFAVTNRAEEGGLKSFADLGGHSVAVAQIGGPAHYAAALIAEKYKLDLRSIRFQAVQSNANVLSAVTGGASDTGVIPAIMVVPGVARGAFKNLGWIGDETPWQSSEMFVATRTADRTALVHRFLRAYQKGLREFHDAFTALDGRRQDGPGAAEALAILAKYTGQTEAQLRLGIAYVDPEGRLDVRDIRHQIEWFKSQNMLKKDVTADAFLDRRYTIPLPEN
jgi:NitT/TauT family transport system substrate-binding protein